MTDVEFYKLVRKILSWKGFMLYGNSEKKEVGGIIFNAFLLKCYRNEKENWFKAILKIENEHGVKYEEFKTEFNEALIEKCLDSVIKRCEEVLPKKFIDRFNEVYREK